MEYFNIDQQKSLALEVLQCVTYFDPSAIVAGGAPRDWEMGFPTENDIDVFFFFRENSTRQQVIDLITRALRVKFPTAEITQLGVESFEENYKLNKNLVRVFEAVIDDQKFQFMEMAKPTYGLVDEFPLSICQAWWVGGEVKYTEDFARSLKYGILYKTNELYADGQKYLNKIRRKFPEYRYFSSKVKALEYVLETHCG